MKLVFVYPCLQARGVALHYPLGLATIATIARELGHSVRVIDLNLESMSALRKSLEDAEAICYSGMITNFNSLIKLNHHISNEYPKLIQIIGGPITMVLKEELLSKGNFHFLSRGSGELTMPAILDLIVGKSSANVAIEKVNDTRVITPTISFAQVYQNSPFPDISLLQYKRYCNDEYLFRQLPHGYGANLETSRGCPFQCTFCDKTVWGNRWVGKSAKDVAEQMFYLNEKFDINKFHIVDDLFVFDRNRVLELGELLSPLADKIVWYCTIRPNPVDKEVLISLKKAGCVMISMGIESANQNILNTIKKGSSKKTVESFVSAARDIGLEVHGNFMIGLPGEDRESLEETYLLLKKLNLQSLTLGIATPLPNTKLYEWAKSQGRIPNDYDYNIANWHQYVNVNLTNDLSNKELIYFFQRFEIDFLFKKQYGHLFFLHPKFIIKSLRKILLLLKSRQYKRLLIAIIGLIKGSLHGEKLGNTT